MCSHNAYFPKIFLIPLDFFLPSGVVGSVWVLSLFCDLWGSPARSRWSVPCRSVSAMQHKKNTTETHQNRDHRWWAQTSETASSEGNQSDTSFNSFTIKANILCCMHVTDAWKIQLYYKFISAFFEGPFQNPYKSRYLICWICKKCSYANKWVHTTHAGDTQWGGINKQQQRLYAAHSLAEQEEMKTVWLPENCSLWHDVKKRRCWLNGWI